MRVIITEPIRGRLKDGKRLNVCHFLRRIRATGEEWHRHIVPGFLRRVLNSSTTSQNDQVSHRDLLAAFLRAVELLLNFLECWQNFRQLCGVIDFPVLLWGKPNARTVGATTLVGSTESGRRSPCCRNKLRTGKARSKNLFLEGDNILIFNQFVIYRWNRVLPDLHFWYQWPQAA